jgi:predicted nucleotidyltransferase component of viral defense system
MSQGKEQSVKDRVKKIAEQQGRTFGEVWQEVVLERWLARLAQSKYRKNFIFKGAMCLARYVDLQRQTKDLDFLLKDLQGSVENVKNYLGEVAAISIDDGFTFESLDVQLLSHTHMQYPGYSVSVIAHLGKTRTKIFIDVGVGDAVKPTEITMHLLHTDKSPLFEKDIELWAYPVESIFAEKMQTAVARSQENSRMKDYHDLICLVRGDVAELRQAL